MKEQFDKRLVEKIKGSFENYDEPFDPKEWEKFSHAYFKKDKTKPLWAWVTLITGVAASLIIGFLVWPVMETAETEEYVSLDRSTAMPEIERQDTETPLFENEVAEDKVNENAIANRKAPPLSPAKQSGIDAAPYAAPSSFPPVSSEVKKEVPIIQIIPAKVKALARLEPLPPKDLEVAQVREREITNPASHFAYDLQKTFLLPVNVPPFEKSAPLPPKNLAMGEVNAPSGQRDTDHLQPKVAPPLAQLKEEDAQKIINNWAKADMPSVMDKRKNDGGVKWGLVMAPQAASNTTMGLNLGGGVMSEISLSRKLKLDVGVTFARQSLVPGQGQNVAMAMNSTPGRATADQLQNAMAFSQVRSPSTAGSVMPASATYVLNFSNLDIPINLKYRVMENAQSGLYLISGLSSMIYLSQSSSETFNVSYLGINQANAFSPNQVQTLTTEITPEDGENAVDLGRMLNLSFGYEYKLSGGTFLSVEPFYKLPIGNMTFVDQQFSIGGVNLRMNFQFKK